MAGIDPIKKGGKDNRTMQEIIDAGLTKEQEYMDGKASPAISTNTHYGGVFDQGLSARAVDEYKRENPFESFNPDAARNIANNAASKQAVIDAEKQLNNIPKPGIETMVKEKNEGEFLDLKDLKEKKIELTRNSDKVEAQANARGAFQENILLGYAKSALANLIPEEWGTTEKETEELKDVNEKMHVIQAPLLANIVSEQKKILEEELKIHDSMPNSMIPNSELFDRAALEQAMLKRKSIIRSAENYINKANGWDALLNNPEKYLAIATMGVSRMVEDLLLTTPAVIKSENNEKLSYSEGQLLKAKADQDQFNADSQDMHTKNWYKWIDGTLESGVFMAGLAGAGKIAGGVKAGAGIGARLLQAGASAAIMPATYSNIADDYSGQMQYDKETGDIYVRKNLQKKVVSELLDRKKDAIANRDILNKKKELTEEESNQLQELNQVLGYSKGKMTYDEIIAKTKEQYEPMSALRSIQHGYTASLAEAISERVFGHYFDIGLKKLAKKSFRIRNTINKFDKTKLSGVWSKGSKGFNKLSGDQLQSIPSEMLEEYAVSPLHALNDWSTDPLTELTHLDPHVDILMQTVIMGTGGRVVGGGVNFANKIKDPKSYAARKEILKKFEEMSNATSDEDVAQYIDLFTSTSSADISSQKIKVERLRAEKKNKEADMLEGRLFRNFVLKAYQTGTTEDLKEAFERMGSNQNLTPETIKAAQKGITRIDQIEKTYKKYKDLPNVGKLVNLQFSIDEHSDNKDIIEEKIGIEHRNTKKIIDEELKNQGKTPNYNIGNLYLSEEQLKEQGLTEEEIANTLEATRIYEERHDPDELLPTLYAALGETNLLIDEAKATFKKEASKEFQDKLKAKVQYVNDFNKEAVQREKDTNKKKKKDGKIAKYELTNEEIESIAAILPGKGLSSFDKQEAVAGYKRRAEAVELEKERRKVAANKPTPTITEDDKKIKEENDKQNEPLNSILTQAENLPSTPLKEAAPAEPSFSEVEDFDIYNEDAFAKMIGASQTDKDNAKSIVDKAVEEITKSTGSKPNFRTMMKHFLNRFDKARVEDLYNIFQLGWTESGRAKTDFNKAYNDLFDPLKESLDKIMGDAESKFNEQEKDFSTEEAEEITVKAKETIVKKQATKVSKPNTSTNILYSALASEGLISTAVLKAGYSALNYTTKIINGVAKKVTLFNNSLRSVEPADNHIVLDFHPLLDPDKFKPNDKANIEFIPEDRWSQFRIQDGYKEDASPIIKTFQEWFNQKIKEDPNFRETEEFANKVPIVITVDNVPAAYIHDTGWYNKHNVADPTGKIVKVNENISKAHKELIEEGKANVAQIRKDFIENGTNTIIITEKKEGIFYEIPIEQPAITIAEANPDAIIVVQTGNKLMMNKGQSFVNNERVLLNDSTDFNAGTNAHTWEIRRIATNKKGQKTYRAYPVLRYTDGDSRTEGISSEGLESMKWAWAIYTILDPDNAGTSYKIDIKGTKWDMSKEEAQKKADEIYKTTKSINLASYDGVHNYIELFAGLKAEDRLANNVKDGQTPGYVYSKVLFQKGTNGAYSVTPTSFIGSTNLNQLGALQGTVPVFSEDGKLTDTKLKYHDYVKSKFKTSIKSFNVGTAEKPIWATSIQPVIHYKSSKEAPTKTIQTDTKAKAQAEAKVKQELEAFGVEENDAAQEAMLTAIDEALKAEGFDIDELTEDIDLDNYDIDDLEDNAARPITRMEKLTNIFNVANKLSQKEENHVIQFLYHHLLKTIDSKYDGVVNKNILKKELGEAYNDIVASTLAQKKEQFKVLYPLYKKNPTAKLKKYLAATKILIEKYDSISNNWDAVVDKAVAHAEKYTDIKAIDDNLDDESENNELREKDYSKESIEEPMKKKTSYQLRRFMAGIAEKNPDNTEKKGPFGLTSFMTFNDVFNSVAQYMNSETDIEPDFDVIMTRLKEMAKTQLWVQNLVDKIENEATDQMKNQFVKVYAKHSLTMKFTMYEVGANGTMIKLYNTNANEITTVIRENWNNHFKATSNLVAVANGYHINKEYAKTLLAKAKSIKINPENIEDNDLRSYLAEFGIELPNEVWQELKDGDFYSSDGSQISFVEQFTHNSGIFFQFEKYLQNIITVDDTEFQTKEKNHPYKEMNNILKTLARMQAKYSTQTMTLTFRDGSKQISGQVPQNYITDKVSRLKRDADPEADGDGSIDKLLSKSITSQSTILQLFKKDSGFSSKFGINHVGIVALKERGKNAGSFSGVTDLNTLDHDIAKFGGFHDMKQGSVAVKFWGISMRIANMFAPTMSDKSNMMYLQTAIFNFFGDHKTAFKILDNGERAFNIGTRELFYEKLVLPELTRIINFNKSVGITNIKGYDKAAQIFNMIPELNNIEVDGVRLIELLAINENYQELTHVELKAKDILIDTIEAHIISKAKLKREAWVELTSVDSEGDITKLKGFDKDYLSQNKNTETLNSKFELASLDFVMNSYLTNTDIITLFAGDPALYAKDDAFGDKEPYAQTDDFYESFARKTDTNFGKRMALLMAPGNKTNFPKDQQQYLQLLLQDHAEISENIKYLIGLYHPELEKDVEIQKLIEQYDATENSATKFEIGKEISKKAPLIADYFDIESTDAQEYTTAKEHLDVMFYNGDLNDAVYTDMTNRLKMQFEAEEQGLPIPEAAKFTPKELTTVMQPIKPVYTGQIEDVQDMEKDVMRTVYIKSSSFPLIPQVTAGRELDILRKKMEELERTTGKNVRASYQSANKVGSIKNPINAFDESLTVKDLEASSLTLNRNDFKIQQDVPYKSDKKKIDEISMGTQIFKLLTGNGMSEITGFKMDNIEGFDGTGRALKNHFDATFINLVNLKRQELYSELGIDADGTIKDMSSYAKKIQEVLNREAKKRNYPLQDIKGLEMDEKNIYDAEGKVIDTYFDFKVPIWLATNGNRYEALLNSIVTNRVMKHKMPGNGYVVGSEAGMHYQSNMRGVDQSRVITLGNYNGKALKASNKNQKPQVFIPSKFKNSKNELIDLFEDFDKNTGEGKYIKTRDDKSLALKENMFDEELLSLFSFRTPSSSHVSASSVEISGFLPPESGDLMIVPKNFTKQKGLDYDVDKENAYAFHHVVTKTGKVEVLKEHHKTKRISQFEDAIKNARTEATIVKSLMADIAEELHGEVGEGYNDLIEFLTDDAVSILKKVERIGREYDIKLAQNEFIRINHAVFNNPNREVQKKLNAVLSMKFANDQANMINERFQKGLADKATNENYSAGFSMLSDEHQKEKMALGAAGKLAIAVYSNFLTLHGLIGQSEADIRLREKEKVGEETIWIDKSVTIGNTTVDGRFGKIMTQDGSRTIAEAFAEKQNTATDNEKEQVLGRVNVNSTTIQIDSLLTALGFDKDENGNSISYTLLSQPIIKDFVKKLEGSRGIMAEYNANPEAAIIEELLKTYGNDRYSYDITYKKIIDHSNSEEILADHSGSLTGDKLLEGISGDIDSEVQIGTLIQFLDLRTSAKILNTQQKIINTNNLGKSMIETIDLNNKLAEFADMKDSSPIANMHSLIGDFRYSKDVVGNNEYTRIEGSNVSVKATTAQGAIVTTGITMGMNLWGGFFPYNDKGYRDVMSEIFSSVSTDLSSDYKKLELIHSIVKESKKYIYSSPYNGLFSQNSSKERQDLFIDSESNEALATYLSKIETQKDSPFAKGIKIIKDNKLVNKLLYDLNSEGSPSLVKYNNTTSDNFDEEYLYNSFPELIIENKPLPPITRDGVEIPYNTMMLAQDLINYAYLEGGVQEAIQFIKYVPIEYLEAVTKNINHPFSKKVEQVPVNQMLQMFNNRQRNNPFVQIFLTGNARIKAGEQEVENTEWYTSPFTTQFMQHNPDKAVQYSTKEQVSLFKKINKDIPTSEAFFLTDDVDHPNFISVKQKTRGRKKQDKWSLYKRTSKGGYQKIDVLGTHGMNEYQYTQSRSYVGKSIIKPTIIEKVNPVQSKPLQANKPAVIETSLPYDLQREITVEKLVDEIMKGQDFQKYPYLKAMLKYLRPMLKADIKLKFTDMVNVGSYNYMSNTVNLNPLEMRKLGKEGMARIVLHELVHSVTSTELRKYFNDDGITLKQGITIPAHVYELNNVFNEFRKTIGEKKINDIKIKNIEKGLTEEEASLLYPATSIFEFAAGMLTEPTLQQHLKTVEYMNSGKTFINKFKEVITKLLGALHPEKITISEAALSTLFDFIKEENTTSNLKLRKTVPTKLDGEVEWEDSNEVKMGNSYYMSDKNGDLVIGKVLQSRYEEGYADEIYEVEIDGKKTLMIRDNIFTTNVKENAAIWKKKQDEDKRNRDLLDQPNEGEDNMPNFTQEELDGLPDCI